MPPRFCQNSFRPCHEVCSTRARAARARSSVKKADFVEKMTKSGKHFALPPNLIYLYTRQNTTPALRAGGKKKQQPSGRAAAFLAPRRTAGRRRRPRPRGRAAASLAPRSGAGRRRRPSRAERPRRTRGAKRPRRPRRAKRPRRAPRGGRRARGDALAAKRQRRVCLEIFF